MNSDTMAFLERIEKTGIILTVALLILIAIVSVLILVFHSKEITWPKTPEEAGYDSEWIIGKTISEVQEKYGEFDDFRHSNQSKDDIATYFVMIPHQSLLNELIYGRCELKRLELVIFFNSSGIATKVYLHEELHGG